MKYTILKTNLPLKTLQIYKSCHLTFRGEKNEEQKCQWGFGDQEVSTRRRISDREIRRKIHIRNNYHPKTNSHCHWRTTPPSNPRQQKASQVSFNFRYYFWIFKLFLVVNLNKWFEFLKIDLNIWQTIHIQQPITIRRPIHIVIEEQLLPQIPDKQKLHR